MPWFIYILECGHGELYTGTTTNLARRLEEHQAKKGGRYTATHQPVRMLYHEECVTRGEALRRELQLQGWTRRKKLALIAGDQILLKAS